MKSWNRFHQLGYLSETRQSDTRDGTTGREGRIDADFNRCPSPSGILASFGTNIPS